MANNPAATTWTPENLWAFAYAYFQKTGKWPPGVPQPPAFDPNTDPTYVDTSSAVNTQTANQYTQLGVTPIFDANGVITGFTYGGGQYLQGAQKFGFDENGNPIAPGDTRYNPFNDLEKLKTSFENRKRGTTNSYAAAGQLYSGAIENQRTNDATGYAQDYDTLKRGAGSFYSGLVANALNAHDTGETTLAGAKGTALNNNLLQHSNDPPPVLTPNLGTPAPAAPKRVRRKGGFPVLTPGQRFANRSGFQKPKFKGY